MTDIEYYNRFKSETIYLYYDTEDVYVKSVPGDGCFAKFKGGKEFQIRPDSDIVVRAIVSKNEVTKEQYDSEK